MSSIGNKFGGNAIGNNPPGSGVTTPTPTVIRQWSTGLTKGGIVSVNGGDDTLIDITAGTGVIVDSTTDPDNPVSTDISWLAKTGYNLTTTATAGDIEAIYLSIDSGGNVVERADLPTPEQRRDTIDLGVVARNDVDQIVVVGNTPTNFVHNPGSQFQDFIEEWGGFSLEGNKIQALTNDLQIEKTVGRVFRNGVNARTNGKDPHTLTSAAQSPVSPFNIKLSDGTDVTIVATELTPDVYDDGTSTPAAVPTGKVTVQFVRMFAEGTVEVLLGQRVFNFMSEAKAALPTIEFTVPQDSKAALALAYVVLKEGATDLSDLTQADFYQLGKRGDIGGIGFVNLNSSGMVFDPGLTENPDGSIDVGDGVVNLYTDSDWSEDLFQYSLTGLDDQVLTDLDTNYVVADYNGGSPIYRVTLDVLEINESDVVPVYTIYRSGTELHTIPWGNVGSGLVNKLHARFVKTERYAYESGVVIGDGATNNITSTSGFIWVGGNRIETPAADSTTDATEFWYHVAGVWTSSAVTTYNNTQYDDGTDLQSTGVGRFVVNWVYQGVESNPHLYYVLGSNNYTLTQAQASHPPASLPKVITSHTLLIGRIIVVQSGGNPADQVDSAFTQNFMSNPVTDHANLSNLQGGTASEYYHLVAGTAAGQIPFWNGTTYSRTETSELVWDDVNKRLGVGVAAPAHQFEVFSAPVDAGFGSPAYGIQTKYNPTFTVTGSYPFIAHYIEASGNGAAGQKNNTYISGYISYVHGGVGDNASLFSGALQYGHVTGDTGTTDAAYGLKVTPFHMAGTITDSYGIFLENPYAGGTVTNYWGLYQQNAGAKNYFAGNLGVGEPAPISPLHVKGAGSGDARGITIHQRSDDAVAPILSLLKERTTGQTASVDDIIGTIRMRYYNDAGTPEGVNGAAIYGKVVAATDGTEDASLFIQQMIAGVSTDVMSFVGGNVGIGTDTPIRPVEVQTSEKNCDFKIGTYDNNGPTVASRFLMFRSRSNTKGVNAETLDGDRLGRFLAQGVTVGTTDRTAAYIDFVQDGNASATLVPGSIIFGTSTDVASATERMRIDSTGRIVTGGNTSQSILAAEGALQVLGTSTADAYLPIGRWSADENGAALTLFKSRNATVGSSTIVQDNDWLGKIFFAADDGNDFTHHGAFVGARINGTPGENDIPTELVFATTANGAAAATQRMVIDSAGNVGIGTDSPSALIHGSSPTTEQTFRIERIDAPAKIVSNFGSGNSAFRYTVNNLSSYLIGLDDSDSDKFKISFGSSDDATFGVNDYLTIDTVGNIKQGSGGSFATGGETAPDVDYGGLCLNHGANDGFILTLKSSDVAHGITSILETDTYTTFGKYNANSGGLLSYGATEGTIAYDLVGLATTEDTTTSTASRATIITQSTVKSGTTVTNQGATANIFAVLNNANTRFIIKGNGNVEADGTVTSNSFDFAEYFESEDGKTIEDATPVVFAKDGKIRAAKNGEQPFGVVSATACFVGNKGLDWSGRYLRDKKGRYLTEKTEYVSWLETKEIEPAKPAVSEVRPKTVTVEVEVSKEEIVFEGGKYIKKNVVELISKQEQVTEKHDLYNEFGEVIGTHSVPVMEEVEVTPAKDAVAKEIRIEYKVSELPGGLEVPVTAEYRTVEDRMQNPDYDPSQVYISRTDRPEWNIVGLVGQVYIRKESPVNPSWIFIREANSEADLYLIK